MIGLRIPSDLLIKIDTLKDKEQIDHTSLILRALRYWVSVGGKVSEDAEYLNCMKNINENISKITTDVKDIKLLKEQITEQQKVISILVKMLPENK